MTLPKRYLLLPILAAATVGQTKPSTSAASQPSTHPATGHVEWFRGMIDPPKLNLRLPADFTTVTFNKDGKWSMYDGVIWSDAETAKPFERAQVKKMTGLKKPLFYVHLSSDVAQKPGTDNFTIEPDLEKAFTAAGMTEVNKEKLHWGAYPVLVISGKRPDKTTFFAAWIGINSPEGWTIVVDYRVPTPDIYPAKDSTAIWRNFLEKTTQQK